MDSLSAFSPPSPVMVYINKCAFAYRGRPCKCCRCFFGSSGSSAAVGSLSTRIFFNLVAASDSPLISSEGSNSVVLHLHHLQMQEDTHLYGSPLQLGGFCFTTFLSFNNWCRSSWFDSPGWFYQQPVGFLSVNGCRRIDQFLQFLVRPA